MITDIEEAIERYSIMTVEGKATQAQAMEYIAKNASPCIIKELQDKMQFTQYFQNNIALYPCNQEATPLVKIYDDKHTQIEASKVATIDQLQAWKNKGVALFAFYPANNNLLVLDLDNSDTHANKANGIDNFINWLEKININDTLRGYFKEFPKNFPCYVTTPHNGIHLYFNALYVTDDIKRSFDNSVFNGMNIEIKYQTQCTAGDSVRHGKNYILHGEIANAPRCTLDLLNAMTKKIIKAPAKYSRQYFTNSDNKSSWNTTPEGIINKAYELYSNETPHQFVYKTAVLFKNAGFTKEDALQYIEQTDTHANRKDKADTETAINSIF